MKKTLWSIVIIVAVVLVAAVIGAAVFLDGIVKKGVETVGPQITKTTVTLKAVHIGLLTGSAKVEDFVIGNPEGYTAPNAISVGVAEVGVAPFSILSDKIVIRSIHVEAPEITFEGNPFSGNNLSQLMDNVNGVAKAGGPKSTNETAAASKPAKKIEVDDFFITGAKVHAIITGLGSKDLTVTLPDIHLTGMGKGTAGITATDLTRRVLAAISAATIKAVAAAATDLGKGATDAAKDAANKAATDGVNKITKGLGGLLGK